MKDLAYYSNPNISFPRKEDYTTIYVYKSGKVVLQCTPHEWPDVSAHYSNYTVEREVDEAAFKAARAAYGNRHAALQEEFKRDLFEDNGVTGHPKAQQAYALAWEYGHASGLSDVRSYFEDLVALIKD